MGKQAAPEVWDHPNVHRVTDKWAPPVGPFDAKGPWEHSYDIHFLNIRSQPNKPWAMKKHAAVKPEGKLRVAAKPNGEGVELSVMSTAQMSGDATNATIECRLDALCTPDAWEFDFTNTAEEGGSRVAFSRKGGVVKGALIRDGQKVRDSAGLKRWTCDWTLFEAVQRLSVDGKRETLSFDMIEYLDVVRREQSLVYRGQTSVVCKGASIDATDYMQYGQSVIPKHYYIDKNGRLFMVLGTRRLFVLVGEKVG